MPTPESLLISGILIHKDMQPLYKAHLTSDVLIRNRAELLFIEKNGIPSIAFFKAQFPDFKVLKVNKKDVSLLVERCRDNRIKKELTDNIQKAILGMKSSRGISVVASSLENNLRDINAKFGKSRDSDVLGEFDEILDMYKIREDATNRGTTVGVPFGLSYLDKYLGGMKPSNMITIAARMANFKTWTLLKFGASAVLNDKKVLFISLEMSKEEIAYRLWTLLSHEIAKAVSKKKRKQILLYNDKLLLGAFNSNKVDRILRYMKKRFNASFIVPEIRGKFSIADTAYKIEQHKPDLVIFDYFGLAVGGSGKVENWMEAAGASNKCKEIARTYNIPFIIAAQVNRAGADKLPQLHNIAISDSIGADSDSVLMLMKRGNNDLTIYCAKNRHGQDGWKVMCELDINKGRIEEKFATTDADEDE